MTAKWSLDGGTLPRPPLSFLPASLAGPIMDTFAHKETSTLTPSLAIIYVHKILIRKGNGVTYRIGYRKMTMKVGR